MSLSVDENAFVMEGQAWHAQNPAPPGRCCGPSTTRAVGVNLSNLSFLLQPPPLITRDQRVPGSQSLQLPIQIDIVKPI